MSGTATSSLVHGIRENLAQFVHQAIQVSFVGLMIGMERNVLPTLAEHDFGVAKGSFLFLAAFVLSFGLVKGPINFIAGGVSDRIGRKPVLLLGWVAGIPVPLLIYFAPNWNWIILANVFLGINQGLAWTMTVNSKIDIIRADQRGFGTGVNETCGYAAIGLAGVVTGYLAGPLGPRLALLLFGLGVVGLGLTFALACVRETLPWAHLEAKTKALAGGETTVPSTWQVFTRTSFHDPTLRALCQAGAANKIADTLIWVMVPVYLHQRGLDVVTIGWITGLYAMTWGVSQLWTGHLSDRIGRKRPIVSGLWLLAAGIVGMVLGTGVIAWCVSSVVMGFAMALLYPTLIAAMADGAHPLWRGRVLGTYRYWRDTGYAIGALTLGAVAQMSGTSTAAFWVTAALLAISAGWVMLGAEETRPRQRAGTRKA
ncbi:MAG: MFS transporter [Betaproteobacteria bacterium]|jgi:MFS family permease|nr:MFS transporter [Betaproteobacteria bacterium]